MERELIDSLLKSCQDKLSQLSENERRVCILKIINLIKPDLIISAIFFLLSKNLDEDSITIDDRAQLLTLLLNKIPNVCFQFKENKNYDHEKARSIRLTAGLSVLALSKIIGKGAPYLSKLETGRIPGNLNKPTYKKYRDWLIENGYKD